MATTVIKGWFADLAKREFCKGCLKVTGRRIASISEEEKTRTLKPAIGSDMPLILAGLVDSHVHLESSMVMPSRFAEEASRYGTVATVSDPHEIANVLGLDGIRLMIEDAKKARIKMFFTAPSCVPATEKETSGARLKAKEMETLFKSKEVVALGEMMNYPGVIFGEEEVMEKIRMAKKYQYPVDGHAPGLIGKDLEQYIGAGISTDHECMSLKEAEEKISLGMKVLIREGSAARNFDALWPLIGTNPESVMLCTDDFHPDDLAEGHIDRLIRKGLQKGLDFFDLYQAASLNPIRHYHLNVGLLRANDPADFILVDDLDRFHVSSTWINGTRVAGEGASQSRLPEIIPVNRFEAQAVDPADLAVRGEEGMYRVIRAFDGELVTEHKIRKLTENQGYIMPDIRNDILKIVVINRYGPGVPSIGWIEGFGLKKGAMASSIAHDSHNLIAVGTDDKELSGAINLIIRNKGGISVFSENEGEILPLPVAGLMGMDTVTETGQKYRMLTEQARAMGSELKAPFMTLAFMALLVIPHLKIGDAGLFDGDRFSFVSLKAQ